MALRDFFLFRADGRAGGMTPVSPVSVKPKAGTLAAIVGIAAAGMLLELIPAEESGRKVEATVAADGTATVRHISGKQYLRTYFDIAGIATACDGITRKDKIKLGKTYTEADCAAFLESELIRHAAPVMKCIPAFERNKEASAFQIVPSVSHAYNFGPGATCASSIARHFNAGQTKAACDAFLPWNKARVNGVKRPVVGLTRRRQRERQYCLTGVLPGYTPANLRERLKPWR